MSSEIFAELPAVIVLVVPLGFWIRSLLRIGFAPAALISTAITVSTIAICFWLGDDQHAAQWSAQASPAQGLITQRLRGDDATFFVVTLVITVNLAIALVIKVYRASILAKMSPAESSPGVAGMRAWLSPLNVIAAVCVAAGAYMALDYDYIGVFIAGLCMLLAFPLVGTMLQHASVPAAPTSSGSAAKPPAEERQRVLALVEAGKISAEDGAELLTALAQSQAASGDAVGAVTGPRRIMLVGAGITLVGFFLPWFTVNVAQAMGDLTHSLMQGTSQFPGNPQPNINVDMNGTPIAVPNGMRIDVRGGDVQHGLGWIILAAGLGAACLPFFWPAPAGNTRQMRNAVFAALAVGSVLALYVLSGSFNAAISIEPGFVLAMAGYIVLWVGGIREYITPIGNLQPAIAVV